MTNNFPLEYTLENGSQVLVSRSGASTFDFNIKPENGAAQQFTYVQDGRTKSEVEESLSFEELDALRRFWLETEEII